MCVCFKAVCSSVMYFVWRADPWLKSHPRVRLGFLISGDASVENVGKSAVRDVRRGHMMRPALEMCLRWCTAEVNESARPCKWKRIINAAEGAKAADLCLDASTYILWYI